eukprot:TRINITY_DN52020_c0_g1_i1.p2 TRINITY_DN52020_c0_g1~~TRINITY_DN52020_c0_g1_i1.p2  ORF type:complete len:153 (+),score=49.16 TRINITY_DN52020_c0_g1_i1:104-562(+)
MLRSLLKVAPSSARIAGARANVAPPTAAARRWCAAGAATPSQVQLNDNAVRKLNSLREKQQNAVLRFTVNSGGCSGYSYEFSLVGEEAVNESGVTIVEREGAKMVVDELSLSFLDECEVDYVEEMIRSSFQVTKNKLADSKCGCGSSFSIAF